MAIVRLKPHGTAADQEEICVPVGKVVVGRGPFLRCSDKKVSRQHAQLELTEAGCFYLTALHLNPCFYLLSNATKWKKLTTSDQRLKMENGDKFSLTPDLSGYEVLIDSDHQKGSSPVQGGAAEIALTGRQSPDGESFSTKTDSNVKVVKEPNPELVEATAPANSSKTSPGQDLDTNRQRTLPSWLTHMISNSNSDSPSTSRQPKGKREVKKKAPKSSSKRGNPSPANTDRLQVPMDIDVEIDPLARASTTVERVLEDHDSEKIVSNREADNSGQQHMTAPPASTSWQKCSLVSDSESDGDCAQVTAKEDKIIIQNEKVKKPVKHPSPHLKCSIISDSEKSEVESGDKNGAVKPKEANSCSPKTKPQNMQAVHNQERKKKRKPCSFGGKCYRKNPVHLSECSHPGDSDYRSGSDRSEDEDDERQECEFGTDCYRKNPQHLKDYKHTERPKRAAAKAVKRRVVDDEEGSDGSYDGSFIDDSDEDKDYAPDLDELKLLKKEAKDFVKNKKMYKLN